jgi:pilus assembly protein CpaC
LGNFEDLSASIGSSTALTGEPFSIGNLIYDSSSLGPLTTVFRALEQDGLVNTLAEPNLTAISGETASFLAGGEFPVPVGRDDGELTIEFKKFGVALGFTPTVLSENRISLNLATEVSQLSNQGRLELNDASIPSLTVRRAESTVELGSGGRLMIAGLIESDASQSMTGLPGVSNIPVLGELFKSRSFRRDESELVVMVTAYIVGPSKEPTGAKIVDEQGIDITTPDKKPELSATAKHIKSGLQTAYGDKAADLIRPHFQGFILDK